MANVGKHIELPLNEMTLQFTVYDFTSDRQHFASIPFLTICLGISDVFSFTRAGIGHDFEIKISLADFKADFKNKKWKHACMDRRWVGSKPDIPNYFWFVAPEGIIPIKLIPEYAGFIEVSTVTIENCVNRYDKITKGIFTSHSVKRIATRLHRGKFNKIDKFSKQLNSRYWTLMENYLMQKYLEKK